MTEQADIEAALARATAAYKNVSAERDALKDANDRAAAAEAENEQLRAALGDRLRAALGENLFDVLRERDRLREALKGLVGLVQLVRSRDDCSTEIKQALTDHYRLDDALAALAKEAGK